MLECRHMNNELLRGTAVEQFVNRPVFPGQSRMLQRYDEADYALDDMRQLAIVRDQLGEIAVVPIVNVIAPVQQAEVTRKEPETLGEAFLDLLFGFIGIALIKSGEFMESFGEKK